jgi:putative copper export protein
MADELFVFMRWLHLTSMATLVGGMLFGRAVMAASESKLAPDARESFESHAAACYRPLVIAAIIGLLLSGTYNVLTNPGHSVLYHTLLGIKLLLALHVFAAALLVTRPHNPRRTRMMTGTVISGLIIVAISAYLRRIY